MTPTGEVIERPTVRTVLTESGDFVAELTDRTIALRPRRSRRGGPAEVLISWGQVYLRAMWERVEERRKAKARARRGKRK